MLLLRNIHDNSTYRKGEGRRYTTNTNFRVSKNSHGTQKIISPVENFEKLARFPQLNIAVISNV